MHLSKLYEITNNKEWYTVMLKKQSGFYKGWDTEQGSIWHENGHQRRDPGKEETAWVSVSQADMPWGESRDGRER